MEKYLIYLAIGLVGLAVVYLVAKLVFRRHPGAESGFAESPIDLSELGDAGPDSEGPVVEYYNVPMRLAAIVMAPAGRGSSMPPPPFWPKMLDEMVPGMAEVIERQQPVLLEWPEQLSASGFAAKFFAQAKLPGDHGKGSPWSAVTGRCESNFDPVLVGMIFRAANPNNLGRLDLERATKWLDVLRVRHVA